MDNPDHGNMNTSGHESVGVYVCRKCGWPFPNSHPSSRHRRAHKRICGSIEGFRLADSQDLTVSDDDNLSDEQPKTPSPKSVERNNSEKHNGPIGLRSSKSEDDVFSDAVTEFSESGFSPGVEERLQDARVGPTHVEKTYGKDRSIYYSFKDSAFPDTVEPSNKSTISSQTQNPEVLECTTNLSGSNLESQVHVSSSTEEPAVILSDEKNGLASDLYIKPDTPADASQYNKTIIADDDEKEGRMTYVGQDTDAKGNDEINLDRNAVLLSPSEYAGQTSGTQSASQAIEEMISDPMPADGVLLKEEEYVDGMAYGASLNDPAAGDQSIEGVNAIDIAQIKVGAEERIDFAKSVSSIEGFTGKGDPTTKLYASDDVADLEKGKIERCDVLGVDSREDIAEGNLSLKTKTASSSSSHHDSQVVAEDVMDASQGFSGKGDPITKLQVSDGAANLEKGNIEKCDVLGVGRREEPVEGNLSLKTKTSSDSASSHHESQAVAEDVMDASEGLNANSDPTPKLHVIDDAGDLDKGKVENNDVLGVESREEPAEENLSLKTKTDSESASCHHESQVVAEDVIDASLDCSGKGDLTTKLHVSDDAGDLGKGKIENFDVLGVESREKAAEENLSLKTKTDSESASRHYESQVVEEVMDAFATKLPETELTNLDRVSDAQDGIRKIGIKGNDYAQEECVAEHGRDIETLQQTSEDHATKVSILSPLDTESSIQSSAAIDDNHAKEFDRVDSGINQSLKGESSDNNVVRHQLGASANDASADSLSHADSLEVNWGSVSVLSTQSDIPPVVDAETLPSAKAVRADLEKPKGITEGQYSDKSDVFEAPSFMTLVEPGGGDDHKAAVTSEIQTAQNVQQQKDASPQAGWFPSLSHGVTESQGRKKNEEIIAKVTNWTSGKQQHTPLKSLLGEAKLETKPKENQAAVVEKNETAAKATTVSSILSPEVPIAEPAKRETGDSPTRYAVDIKREKRKVKGKPYWAQFMCCSSVN